MLLLVVNWGSVGVKIVQLILSLSILVILHELGHFMAARYFKCRVDKFYLFFDPWFSLFKFKKGETEYGIGWLPLGGYVKIAGMVDESMDKEQLKQPHQPWEMRSKPAWQRLIVMLGGVTMNLILAFVLFVIIAYTWGDEYIPTQNLQYGVHADSLAQQIGIRDGDRIVSIDGQDIENLNAIIPTIVGKQAKEVAVLRGAELVHLPIPSDFIHQVIKNKSSLVEVRHPVVVETVSPQAHFIKGRLQPGDRLFKIADYPFTYFHELVNIRKLIRNQTVPIQVLRGKDTVTVVAQTDAAGAIGFISKSVPTRVVNYNLPQAIPAGISKSWQTLDNYTGNLKLLFTGKVNPNESMGGMISVGNLFPSLWNWQKFWIITAVLSIMLAVVNILPIPGLDGGHAVFALYEMITKHKPSDKFMEYVQTAGLVIVLGLLFYGLGLDILRLFR